MSAIATASLWKVSIEAGTVYYERTGAWLFTNERAAKAFAKAAQKKLPAAYVGIEEIDAYKTAGAALFQSYPFEELIPA